MILPPSEDRGIVVFKLWPSLAYEKRLAFAFTLIGLGFVIQMATESFPIGGVVLLAGNLLLVVSGYDNRVDFRGFDPASHWERVELGKLEELAALDRRIRQWDASALDITNALGAVVFFFLAGGLVALAIFLESLARILVLDALVLLVPHWVTGIRSILVRPKLMVRVHTIRQVLARMSDRLAPHDVQLMMLLQSGDTKLPEDLKFKVVIKDHDPGFLGLYGQVVLNEVQGSSHPYFYTVLVAREGFGLDRVHDQYRSADDRAVELKRQGNVEVLVLRQRTTRTSGYETPPPVAAEILREGLALAEQVAGGTPRVAGTDVGRSEQRRFDQAEGDRA